MKIVNVCVDDYANFSYCNAKALQSVGIDCTSYKIKPHVFKYEHESEVVSSEKLAQKIREADLVQIMHSDIMVLGLCIKYNKKCVVYHTGTRYRSNADSMNNAFNNLVKMCFTDQCEFMDLGAKNITYVATAIDTDHINLAYNKHKLRSFAHYPSNPINKGTATIRKMLTEHNYPYDVKWEIDESKVSHAEQLRRMAKCDVYIELFQLEQDGKPYGCFGVTAFEAAAMGKPVITNNVHEEVYKKVYGKSPFHIANTPEQFFNAVAKLRALQENSFEKLCADTRELIVKNHSYKATGNYLKNILEKL